VVILWTVGIVLGAFRIAQGASEPEVYKGTEVSAQVDTSHFLLIGEENVTVQAAAAQFFVLNKASGESIVPLPATPPLGWTEDTYYFAAPVEVPGGKWNVAIGFPTVLVTSDSPVEVQVIKTDSAIEGQNAGIFFVGMIAWMAVLGLFLVVGFFDW